MKKQSDLTWREAVLYAAAVGILILYGWGAGIPLVALFLFFIFAAYLKLLSLKNEDRRFDFLHLGFLFVLGIGVTEFFHKYAHLSAYLVPVAAFTMLVSLLYHELELSLIFSMALGFYAGLIYGEDLYLTVTLSLGGIAGAMFVWQARRRSKIITAGFFVGLIQALTVLTFFRHLGIKSLPELRFCVTPLFGGVLSAFLVAGFLPVFEFLFKVVTNISLLEVADFNHPLLKRLVFEAPGTYHHSLMVGNMSEMAAEAVGANALLARVGAYYHDIGKLEKPEYFSENQDRSLSKHDQLSASMSTLVIMDHVKSGMELARKNRLNNAIIDFITQHHGTSLVYYFYRRALESTKDETQVQEEVFRYPGPKPQTKETAIVLLADSVEAACRTLEEPTAERITDVVRKIINNKFIDGQLDACALTLKDLDRISATFIHILAGFYHSRVEYPPAEQK